MTYAVLTDKLRTNEPFTDKLHGAETMVSLDEVMRTANELSTVVDQIEASPYGQTEAYAKIMTVVSDGDDGVMVRTGKALIAAGATEIYVRDAVQDARTLRGEK